MITVELIYLADDEQFHQSHSVAEGSTVQDVLTASDLLRNHPEWDINTLAIGIFSKKVALSHIVQQGDRIELYRSLVIDPKESRRKKLKD